MKFDDLLTKIQNNNPVTMTIKGKARETAFVASYSTEHFPYDEYLKVFFTDGTLLEVMPGSEDLFFCDDERNEISRDLIKGDILEIDGKKYELENGDDEQFLKKIYYGNIKDGEGGCVFSDYSFDNEIWSLAVLDNGMISDVHAIKIELNEIILD